jgi:hypothetical protein
MIEFFKKLGSTMEQIPDSSVGTVIQLLLLTVDTIRKAEETFKGVKQGRLKKQYVMDVISITLSATPIPVAIRPLILMLIIDWIDIVVETFNTFGWGSPEVTFSFPSGTEV